MASSLSDPTDWRSWAPILLQDKTVQTFIQEEIQYNFTSDSIKFPWTFSLVLPTSMIGFGNHLIETPPRPVFIIKYVREGAQTRARWFFAGTYIVQYSQKVDPHLWEDEKLQVVRHRMIVWVVFTDLI